MKREGVFPQRRLTPGGQAASSLQRRTWSWSQKARGQVGGVHETPPATRRHPESPVNKAANASFSVRVTRKPPQKHHRSILQNLIFLFSLRPLHPRGAPPRRSSASSIPEELSQHLASDDSAELMTSWNDCGWEEELLRGSSVSYPLLEGIPGSQSGYLKDFQVRFSHSQTRKGDGGHA